MPQNFKKKPKSMALVAGSGGTLQEDAEERAQLCDRQGEFESQSAEVMNLEAAAQLFDHDAQADIFAFVKKRFQPCVRPPPAPASRPPPWRGPHRKAVEGFEPLELPRGRRRGAETTSAASTVGGCRIWQQIAGSIRLSKANGRALLARRLAASLATAPASR